MPKTGMLVRISLVLAAVAALATVVASTAGAARQDTALTGAGSTLVAPLVAAWTNNPNQAGSPFTQANPGITVSYSSVGSGAGVLAIRNNQVDFGASDAPLSMFASNATCDTCYQIPWALTGVAVIYHIDGVTKPLNMSGPVLAKIFLGQIPYWDDKSIKALNPGVSIPHTAILTVHRSSASGTTAIFTQFLSAVSSAFKSQTGAGVAPPWQGSNYITASSSSNMDSQVHSNNGAVGYVGVDYAIPHNLVVFKIKNRKNHYIAPSLASIAVAAKAKTKPEADGSIIIVNPPAAGKFAKAYPIAGYTYVDVQKQSNQAGPLKTFLKWAVTSGQASTYTTALVFDPLPAAVVTYDKATIAKITG